MALALHCDEEIKELGTLHFGVNHEGQSHEHMVWRSLKLSPGVDLDCTWAKTLLLQTRMHARISAPAQCIWTFGVFLSYIPSFFSFPISMYIFRAKSENVTMAFGQLLSRADTFLLFAVPQQAKCLFYMPGFEARVVPLTSPFWNNNNIVGQSRSDYY